MFFSEFFETKILRIHFFFENRAPLSSGSIWTLRERREYILVVLRRRYRISTNNLGAARMHMQLLFKKYIKPKPVSKYRKMYASSHYVFQKLFCKKSYFFVVYVKR